MGLATEVAPADEFDERLEAVASSLRLDRHTHSGTATQLLTDSYERGLEGHLAVEADAIAGASKTDDYEIGLEAFFGDGDPEFVGR